MCKSDHRPEKVSDTTHQLSAVSEETVSASDEIAKAIEEVATGATEQAAEVENVNEQSERLSVKIKEIEHHADSIKKLSPRATRKRRTATVAGSVASLHRPSRPRGNHALGGFGSGQGRDAQVVGGSPDPECLIVLFIAAHGDLNGLLPGEHSHCWATRILQNLDVLARQGCHQLLDLRRLLHLNV